MVKAALLLCLSVSSFSQAETTPEQASAQAAQSLRELASSAPSRDLLKNIGSYQEMVRQRSVRDLTPKAGAQSAPTANIQRNDPLDPRDRFATRTQTETVDINVVRLGHGLVLGAGAGETAIINSGVTERSGREFHGLFKIELGGAKDGKAGIHWPPSATYTSTDLAPSKVSVLREEFTRGLKDLHP